MFIACNDRYDHYEYVIIKVLTFNNDGRQRLTKLTNFKDDVTRMQGKRKTNL